MDKNRYMISEAADLVEVESHVLRYWEDELELEIPRNEMGHRYYTRENLDEFQQIKELKEEGYQLKAIKMILKNGGNKELVCAEKPVNAGGGKEENTIKLEQFQKIMNAVVKNALEESNRDMGHQVTDKIIKEMNYLARMQEEQSEEQYKKLDQAIRQYHQGKKIKIKPEKEKKEGKKTNSWKPKFLA